MGGGMGITMAVTGAMRITTVTTNIVNIAATTPTTITATVICVTGAWIPTMMATAISSGRATIIITTTGCATDAWTPTTTETAISSGRVTRGTTRTVGTVTVSIPIRTFGGVIPTQETGMELGRTAVGETAVYLRGGITAENGAGVSRICHPDWQRSRSGGNRQDLSSLARTP